MAVSNPKPMHPGRVLATVFMADHELNQSQLAEKLGCTAGKINEIVNGKRGISPEFAIALEAVFNMSASVWVRMQGEFDLAQARSKSKSSKKPATKKRRAPSSGSPTSSSHMAAKVYG